MQQDGAAPCTVLAVRHATADVSARLSGLREFVGSDTSANFASNDATVVLLHIDGHHANRGGARLPTNAWIQVRLHAAAATGPGHQELGRDVGDGEFGDLPDLLPDLQPDRLLPAPAAGQRRPRSTRRCRSRR